MCTRSLVSSCARARTRTHTRSFSLSLSAEAYSGFRESDFYRDAAISIALRLRSANNSPVARGLGSRIVAPRRGRVVIIRSAYYSSRAHVRIYAYIHSPLPARFSLPSPFTLHPSRFSLPSLPFSTHPVSSISRSLSVSSVRCCSLGARFRGRTRHLLLPRGAGEVEKRRKRERKTATRLRERASYRRARSAAG